MRGNRSELAPARKLPQCHKHPLTRSRRLGANFYEELNEVKHLCAHMYISIEEMRSKPYDFEEH